MTCAWREGCDGPGRTRGLCSKHYQFAKAHGLLDDYPRSMVAAGASLDERLRHHGWDVSDAGCWVWRGSTNSGGYGQLAVGGTQPSLATRAAFTAWVRPLEPDEVVCHRCDNPPCINPEHLFPGDRLVNNRDSAAKRRTANGELKSSHKLTDAQVVQIREAYAAGGVLHRELAERYGVSKSLIGFVLSGKRRPLPTNWR